MEQAWIQTYSGKRVNLLSFMECDVSLQDIAHSLANLCRFNGHTIEYYSVAQHSVLVSYLVREQHAIGGLMHDAAEAYIGDIIRPIKRISYPLEKIEDHIKTKIIGALGRFDIDIVSDEITAADNNALKAEANLLITKPPNSWFISGLNDKMTETAENWLKEVGFWLPEVAKEKFKDRYQQLTGYHVA